jgi:hypothetical protein
MWRLDKGKQLGAEMLKALAREVGTVMLHKSMWRDADGRACGSPPALLFALHRARIFRTNKKILGAYAPESTTPTAQHTDCRWG